MMEGRKEGRSVLQGICGSIMVKNNIAIPKRYNMRKYSAVEPRKRKRLFENTTGFVEGGDSEMR